MLVVTNALFRGALDYPSLLRGDGGDRAATGRRRRPPRAHQGRHATSSLARGRIYHHESTEDMPARATPPPTPPRNLHSTSAVRLGPDLTRRSLRTRRRRTGLSSRFRRREGMAQGGATPGYSLFGRDAQEILTAGSPRLRPSPPPPSSQLGGGGRGGERHGGLFGQTGGRRTSSKGSLDHKQATSVAKNKVYHVQTPTHQA